MPREITDEEYNFLQGRKQVADFVESIYNDPALSKDAKALIKRKYPQVQIPDHDLEERFNQRLDEDRKQRDEEKRAAREAEEEKRFTETRKQIQQEYGFTEDAMKDLEKFMVEKNVGDYAIAAEYHVMKNPKQSDATQHDGLWHHQRQDNFANIAKDPEGWARDEIYGALIRDQAREKGRQY
jgi:hypothetical protein